MAVVEEVQDALVQFIAGLIYPNGVDAPATCSVDVKVYPGWPMPDVLDKDLKHHLAHVSVFTRPEERNVSRGLNESYTVESGPDTGKTLKVVGRQEQLFQISLWCETPDVRKELSALIDPELKDVKRLLLPDHTWGRVIYRNHNTDDGIQKTGIYRKELFYYIEYATTKVTTDYVIKHNVVNVTSQTTPF